MQAIFRHLGAALICAAVAYLGGVSAGLFAASLTGAAISIVITVFGVAATDKIKLQQEKERQQSQQPYYNGYSRSYLDQWRREQQAHMQRLQAPVDAAAKTVKLLKIALVGAVCGLPSVKETWFMVLDMDYTFRGTPWWAFVFHIAGALAAWAIVSSKSMRRIVLGECQDDECQRIAHGVCHILATAALLSLAFNVTSVTVLSYWLVLPAFVAMSLMISYSAIADGAVAGYSFSKKQYIRLRTPRKSKEVLMQEARMTAIRRFVRGYQD